MDKDTKILFLKMIKSIDLQPQTIPNSPNKYQQKWFKFGAYYALKLLADKIEKA